MTRLRSAASADRISSCAILMAGVVCGVLVFMVALPLALSSPFPTPKQGEWIIQGAVDTASAVPPPLVPPPMEPLPVGEAELVTGALAAPPSDDAAPEPNSEPKSASMVFAARWD